MKNNPVRSRHIYFRPIMLSEEPFDKKPVLLTEFGGYAKKVEGHMRKPDNTYGYRFYSSSEELNEALRKLYTGEIIPAIKAGLCASIYTQCTDVEAEINGFYTYDRAVCKVNKEEMKKLAKRCGDELQMCCQKQE